MRPELYQNLNQGSVAFTWRQMERGETIRISAVDYFEHLVVLIEVLLRKCKDLDNLSPVTLVDFCPIVHLDFFDVLLPIFLLLWFFAFAWIALDRLIHLVNLRVLRPAAGTRLPRVTGSLAWVGVDVLVAATLSHVLHLLLLAIVGELVGLFVIVIISNIYVDIVLWILTVLILSMLWSVVQRALCARSSSLWAISKSKTLWLDRIWYILWMIEILLWVSTFTKLRRLTSAYSLVITLIVLREHFGTWSLFVAQLTALRVLFLSLLLNWTQLLIDPALVARPNEVVLGRRVLDAGPPLRILTVILLRILWKAEDLGLCGVASLLELVALRRHVVRLIQGWALPDASPGTSKFRALSESASAPAIGQTSLRLLWRRVLSSYFGISLRK